MKKLTVYNVMWGLIALHAVRMDYAVLQMIWEATYFYNFLDLPIWTWWALFVMMLFYALTINMVAFITSPLHKTEFKLLRYKESFGIVAGLQTLVSGLMLVGYTMQGGLQRLSGFDQLSVISWITMAIPMWYLFTKAR